MDKWHGTQREICMVSINGCDWESHCRSLYTTVWPPEDWIPIRYHASAHLRGSQPILPYSVPSQASEMGRNSEYLYKNQMRQVVLRRLTFRKYSVITITSTFTAYTKGLISWGLSQLQSSQLWSSIVRPLWYAAPTGATASLCPGRRSGPGLPGCCTSPTVLPSPVAATVVIYSAIMYLALSLSQLPKFWFWEGGMWDHQVLWLGNVCFPVGSRALRVIALYRWTAALWRWTGFARGYPSNWIAFCI